MAIKNKGTGRRRERITIYKNEVVRDPGGGTDTVPVEYWNTWAEVSQIKGSRVAETFQDTLKKVYSVLIRYRVDKSIDNAMTVSVRGHEMAIHSVDNMGLTDEYIELIVIEE